MADNKQNDLNNKSGQEPAVGYENHTGTENVADAAATPKPASKTEQTEAPADHSGVGESVQDSVTDTSATGPTHATEQTNEQAAGSRNLMILAAILVVIAAVIFGGYYYYNNGGGNSTSGVDMESSMATGQNGQQQQNIDEVFTLPESGSAVATVNGVELPADQFNSQVSQAAQQAQAQGADLSNADTRTGIKEQALDMMINTELLLQAANDAGVSVEEADVTAEVDRIRSNFETEDAFQSQLEAANTTVEELQANLEKDLQLQAYLDQEVPLSEFEVTEAEVESFYQEASAGNPNVPALEEVRTQVEQQVQNQKQQAAIQELLSEIRATAEIENMLDLMNGANS